jgi:predicted transcriptional regulator
MDWKSDITFSLCGHALCTYTSPSDFGDCRGTLNPDWWPLNYSQYGELKELIITEKGCFLNGIHVNPSIRIAELSGQSKFVFRIENKKDAEHVGGFNIFGKGFGNHPQNIRMEIEYAITERA